MDGFVAREHFYLFDWRQKIINQGCRTDTSRGRFHQHFSSSFSANFLSPKNITNCKCRKDVLDTFVSKAAHKMFINLSPAGVNFNSTSTCITFILIFLVLGKLKTAQILIIFYTQNNINKLWQNWTLSSWWNKSWAANPV